MKTLTQLVEQQVHRTARARVRSCTQPGVVWNVLESEMSAFLTDVLQQKLRQERDALLARRNGGAVCPEGEACDPAEVRVL